MKTIQLNIKSLVAFGLLFIASCTYDFPETDPDTLPIAGDADFTKMVSVGNSLTAGFMDGALYTEGQDNSFVSIIANQLNSVGGGDFNQPNVNSENGCFNGTGGCTLGRLYLKISGSSAAPTPTAGDGGVALALYTGDKAALNNFGVPGVTLGGAISPALSANPYYARIASNSGTSTLIGDASAALADGGTFFTFWLGNNDVLGYATAGASAGGTLTSNGAFETYFNLALNEMLDANETAKGAVGNIPNVTAIPFFTTVKWNVITLDATTAGQLNGGLANGPNGGYNGFLNAMFGAGAITADERDKRLLSFSAGSNGVLITDETLTDLTTLMINNGASALVPYAKARQLKSTDLVCLTAGSYLGKPVDITGDDVADGVNGVSIPLVNSTSAGTRSLKGDDLILLPSEITQIQTAVTDFNAIIATAVTANSTRLALVDANATLASLPQTVNGISLTSSFIPPYGAFSLDGVHPNARGAAYIANTFITAINAKFGSRIPLCNPNDYPGNDLPIP